MTLKHLRLVLILFVLMSSTLVYAQSGDIYTFPSGVSFQIPGGGVFDGTVDPPTITFPDVMIIEMVEPEFIGVTAEDTIGAALEDVLVYLLGLVGYTDVIIPAQSFTETLADGREVLGYQFLNSDDLVQTMVVIRFSDDSVGAMNIRSVDAPTAAEQNMMRTLAASFDVAGAVVAVPTLPVKATPVPAATTVPAPEVLGESYTYESGVTFGIPAGYVLDNEDDPPVTLELADVVFMTMVDPNGVGMPAGETMESIVNFAVRNTVLTADDFLPFEVGQREAVFGEAQDGEFIRSMVLVRFADGKAGIIDLISFEPLQGDVLEDVRTIAASFDSASDVATGLTSEQLELVAVIFDEAMEKYDQDDFAGAVDLLNDALSLDPDWGLAVYWRGAAHQNSGNLEAALADFERALALEPDERQVLVDIADTQALLNLMDEAVATLEDYAADPGAEPADSNTDFLIEVYSTVAAGGYHPDFFYGRATQLRAYGRYDEALRDVLVAVTNEPTDPILYALHGSILVDMDRDQEAVSVLTKGLTVEPLSVLFLNRGYAYQALFMTDFDAMIDSSHDFQCVLLTADDSVSAQQLSEAQRALDRMIIQSDEYEPITDVADCAA